MEQLVCTPNWVANKIHPALLILEYPRNLLIFTWFNIPILPINILNTLTYSIKLLDKTLYVTNIYVIVNLGSKINVSKEDQEQPYITSIIHVWKGTMPILNNKKKKNSSPSFVISTFMLLDQQFVTIWIPTKNPPVAIAEGKRYLSPASALNIEFSDFTINIIKENDWISIKIIMYKKFER